jgi:membrane-bound ClpP family serine protease
MWWLIAILIVIGALLLVVELVLLPGITIAGIASLASYCGAAYVAYINYGVNGVLVSIGVIVVVSLLATWFSLRAKTWQKFALHQNIDSHSHSSPADMVKTGERGVAITRLAPMGKVIIGGETYEAKAVETFVDQQTEVEVTGFENFTVVVKPIK